MHECLDSCHRQHVSFTGCCRRLSLYLVFRQEHESHETLQDPFSPATLISVTFYSMKINTISTYVLVYLLTNGHWNLMVPVKADGGSTGGSDAGSTAGSKAGSTAGSTAGSQAGGDVGDVSSLEADGTVASPANEGSTSGDANANLSSGTDGTVAAPANEADGSSSSAGADAGSSLPSGSSGESADASLASVPADGTSSGESADASLASVPADGTSSSGEDGSSGHAAQTVLLNGLYPDHHTSGWHADMAGPDPKLKAKREEALSLAADANKAADELIKAAVKLYKEADGLTKAVEDSFSAVANEDKIEALKAKIDLTAAKVQVEMKQADKIAHENDMTYYSGFPNGWHVEHDPVREKDELLSKNMMYRDSFPNPWHDMNWPMLDEANKNREKKYKKDKEGMKAKIDGKEAQIVSNEEQIASKNSEMVVKKEELEDKNEELNAKKQEVSDLRELIKELNKDLKKLELEARNIASEHSTLNRELLVLDLEMRKLDDEHAKLNNEFLNLLEDDRNLARAFYDTSASIGYLHEKHTGGTYGLYSETDRKVDPRDTFTPYNVDVQGLKHYDPTIPTEVTKAYLGDLYPDMGGSLVIVKKPKELEVHKDVEFNPVDNFSEYPAIIGRGREAKASESSKVGNDKTKVEPPAPEASVPATVVPGDLYPDMGGSLVIVKKPKELEVHKDVEFNPVDNFSEYPAIIGRGREAKASESSKVGNDKTKVEPPAPEASVPATVVPGAGSTEAKPVEDSAEAKAPEVGAKVEESAPVSTAAPAHTAGHVAVPEAKAEVAAPAHTASHVAVPATVKFFKTGADGKTVELVENTDYEKKQVVGGDDRYDFKQNVKCTIVKFGEKEVWKTGEQSVTEPKSVTYRPSLNAIVVRDNYRAVNYKKNTLNDTWVYDSTITRTQRTRQSSDSSTTSTRTGLASPGLARGIAGGSTTNLASSSAKFGGSVTNLDTASTTGSDEGKSTGSSDVANLNEVAEADTHVSASAGSGGSGSSTLRGAGAGKTTH
nr:hypothetical protein MACL_00000943 [Theileria orientalis]